MQYISSITNQTMHFSQQTRKNVLKQSISLLWHTVGEFTDKGGEGKDGQVRPRKSRNPFGAAYVYLFIICEIGINELLQKENQFHPEQTNLHACGKYSKCILVRKITYINGRIKKENVLVF